MAKIQVQVKTKEEIGKVADELYPNRGGFDVYGVPVQRTQLISRAAFIKGYEACQKHYEQELIDIGKEHDTMTESALNMGRTLSMCNDNEGT